MYYKSPTSYTEQVIQHLAFSYYGKRRPNFKVVAAAIFAVWDPENMGIAVAVLYTSQDISYFYIVICLHLNVDCYQLTDQR